MQGNRGTYAQISPAIVRLFVHPSMSVAYQEDFQEEDIQYLLEDQSNTGHLSEEAQELSSQIESQMDDVIDVEAYDVQNGD